MAGFVHFNLFISDAGHHEGAWRLPASDPLAYVDVGYHERLARMAEAAVFDSLFLADSPAAGDEHAARPSGRIEPITMLAALARATDRIGLIATASTTYNQPYNLARRFAALDHISGGRAGWNVVTTAGQEAARNFGLDDQPHHAERYERAAEFLEVARKLWDSWEDGAVVADKDRGVHADEARVHVIDHVGKYFRVRGPMNNPRSPQGHPLIVQAGSSEDGRNFSARHADAVFTAQQTLGDACAFYADMKDRARRLGRDPRDVKILPGLVMVLGSTEAEARALDEELTSLSMSGYGRRRLARLLQVDPEQLNLDRQLPADLAPEAAVEGLRSRRTLTIDMARRDKLTVRELIRRLASGRGHHTVVGTPEQVARTIEHWRDHGAADGFTIMPAVLPAGLALFAEHVAPLLRRRGLLRPQYAGTTLREHYGLARPASRFEAGNR